MNQRLVDVINSIQRHKRDIEQIENEDLLEPGLEQQEIIDLNNEANQMRREIEEWRNSISNELNDLINHERRIKELNTSIKALEAVIEELENDLLQPGLEQQEIININKEINDTLFEINRIKQELSQMSASLEDQINDLTTRIERHKRDIELEMERYREPGLSFEEQQEINNEINQMEEDIRNWEKELNNLKTIYNFINYEPNKVQEKKSVFNQDNEKKDEIDQDDEKKDENDQDDEKKDENNQDDEKKDEIDQDDEKKDENDQDDEKKDEIDQNKKKKLGPLPPQNEVPKLHDIPSRKEPTPTPPPTPTPHPEPKPQEPENEPVKAERKVWNWIKKNKKKILIALGIAALSVTVIVAITQLLPAITAAIEASNIATLSTSMVNNSSLWWTASATEQAALHGGNWGLAQAIQTLTGKTAAFTAKTGIWNFGGVELAKFAAQATANATLAASKVSAISNAVLGFGLGGLGLTGIGAMLSDKTRSNAYEELNKRIKYFNRNYQNLSEEEMLPLIEIKNSLDNIKELSENERQILNRKIDKIINKWQNYHEKINDRNMDETMVISEIPDDEIKARTGGRR